MRLATDRVGKQGFTIVELLIVIVIIALLTTVVIVAYNGVTQQAAIAALHSDLKQAQQTVEATYSRTGTYDNGDELPHSEGVNLEFSSSDSDYCLTASSQQARTSFRFASSDGEIVEGVCNGHIGYVDPGTLTGLTGIEVGYSNSCAIFNSRVYCWGSGGSGQLGDGEYSSSGTPVAVDTSGVLSGKVVTALSSDESHMCALAGGQIYCWGSNWSGQLGDGSYDDSGVPVAVDTSGLLSGKTVTAIAAGYSHTCALADALLYCWGSGGTLGDGNWSGSATPVAVDMSGALAGKTITALAAGEGHTCVVADGRPYCWGSNWSGQLGDGSYDDSDVPVAVDVSGQLSGKTVTFITAGYSQTCAIADGRAYCWGEGGQLGDGTSSGTTVPVAVDTSGPLGTKTVTTMAAGEGHTCAVADGQAYCWGNGGSGQLGDDEWSSSDSPVAVSTAGLLSGKTVTAINTGSSHTCAAADGQVYCWGSGSSGRLGDDEWSSSGVPVLALLPY